MSNEAYIADMMGKAATEFMELGRQLRVMLGDEKMLRDYFAAKAMQSFAAWSAQNSNSSNAIDQHSYAVDAYEWADAMLDAREQNDV